MIDKNLQVSVLMTVYNREKYIVDAIESILNSTYDNFELIIVDDCSTDKSLNIARSYEDLDSRVKVYVNDSNLGDYPNRNKAASYAKGKYIKYVDADDIIYPNTLEIFIRDIQKYPSAELILSSRKLQDTEEFPILYKPNEIYKEHFLYSGCLDIGPLGFMITRDLFNRVNGFTGERFVGDTIFLYHVTQITDTVITVPGLVYWRIHEGQEMFFENQTPIRMIRTLEILDEAFNRVTCPLEPRVSGDIYRKQKKILARSCYKNILKGKWMKESLSLINKYRLIPF